MFSFLFVDAATGRTEGGREERLIAGAARVRRGEPFHSFVCLTAHTRSEGSEGLTLSGFATELQGQAMALNLALLLCKQKW